MVFVDYLAFGLLSISVVSLLILYLSVDAYFRYKKTNDVHVEKFLNEGVMPLALFGGVIFILGFYSEIIWPLQIATTNVAAASAFAGYNILFFDPLFLMGIVVIAFALTVKFGYRMQSFGVLALFSGIAAIYYGYEGFKLNMSSEPLAMLLMYIAFGSVGILSYPITLLIDHMQTTSRPLIKGWYMILFVLFWIAVIGAIASSGYIGFSAVGAHMASAP
ncbi:MAG: DUF981 family protein [Candidatus Thermoplasmatota archaeon]|jgi:putative membrane protein|nr:DUF981 family protein [Candidatus Thermoplasmatota archaeon]